MNLRYASYELQQFLDTFKNKESPKDLSSLIVTKNNADFLKIPFIGCGNSTLDHFFLRYFEANEHLKTWDEIEIVWLLESINIIEDHTLYLLPYVYEGHIFYFTKEKQYGNFLISLSASVILKHLTSPMKLLLKAKT